MPVIEHGSGLPRGFYRFAPGFVGGFDVVFTRSTAWPATTI